MHCIENFQGPKMGKEKALREPEVAKISGALIDEAWGNILAMPKWRTANIDSIVGDSSNGLDVYSANFTTPGLYYKVKMSHGDISKGHTRELTVTKYGLKPNGIIDLNVRTALTLVQRTVKLEPDRGPFRLGRFKPFNFESGFFGLEVSPLPDGENAAKPNRSSTVSAIRDAWPELFKLLQTEVPDGIPS